MITPEDLSLAQSLLKAGKVDPSTLERCLASLAGENAGRPLRAVLEEKGIVSPEKAAAYNATLVPGSLAAGGAPADRTVVPGGAIVGERPAVPRKKIGRYEIVEEVARGGMGIVYRAWEASLNRHVALKVLLAGDCAGDDQIERFVREARAVAALTHPNIVQVFEVGQEAGVHFFAMEFVEGTALDKLLRRDGTLSPRTALRIARDTARALQYAHEKGIVHRDVKPGNIMLASTERDTAVNVSAAGGRPFRVLLADFGLARDTASASSLTLSGNLLGTPAYMSPEQAAGHTSRIDARSDVFALGGVLYEMLSGQQPFQGPSLGDVLSLIMAGECPPVRTHRPGLHRDIEIIIQKAMAREPDRRYASAAEFADDIDRYLNGEAILAAPPALGYRVSRFLRRNAPAAVAAGAILLSAAAAAGWFGLSASKKHRETAEKAAAELEDLRGKVRTHIARARELAEVKEFDEAMKEIEVAEKLLPGNGEAAQAARELRLGRTLARVRELIETPGVPADWEAALALVETAGEFRDEPAFRVLTRRVLGTGTWAAASAVPDVEVDIAPAEPGVLWDEETFPSMEAARSAGLCRGAGPAPVGIQDLPFGDHYVVFSRDGRALRVVPIRLLRSADIRLEYRELRVGKSPEATHGTLAEAMAVAQPGAAIFLEAGTHQAGISVANGVLVAALPGASVEIRGDRTNAFSGGPPVHGVTLRDLTILDAGSYGIAFGSMFRPSVIRCHVIRPASLGMDFSGSTDPLVRECRVEDTKDFAIRFSGCAGGLIWGSHVRKTGWCGIELGPGSRMIRSSIREAHRVGVWVGPIRSEVRECLAQDCSEWAFLLEGSRDAVIRDNLVINCSHVVRTANPGSIVANHADGGDISHNTIIGGAAFGILAIEATTSIRNNIIWNVRPFTTPTRNLPGIALGFEPRVLETLPVVDHNLLGAADFLVRWQDIDCATLLEVRDVPRARLRLDWDPLKSALAADPRLDAAGRLAPDSPARAAASDGSNLGVRWEAIDASPQSGAAWIARENGRPYLARAREALARKDYEGARSDLRKARLLCPGEPEIGEIEKQFP